MKLLIKTGFVLALAFCSLNIQNDGYVDPGPTLKVFSGRILHSALSELFIIIWKKQRSQA